MILGSCEVEWYYCEIFAEKDSHLAFGIRQYENRWGRIYWEGDTLYQWRRDIEQSADWRAFLVATAVNRSFAQVSKRAVRADKKESQFRVLAATMLSVASFLFLLGIAWDIQWHADVGPDTFWTAPHTTFYSAVAIAGMVSLVVGLASTTKYRSKEPGVSDETTTSWLGIFRAPLGFIVAGLGAAAFLTSGLYDLWWHTLYGFDVTLLSPPHFGLLFSGPIIMVGAVYAFASEANRSKVRGDQAGWRWGAFGTCLNLAILMAQMSLFLLVAIDNVPIVGPFILYGLLTAILFPLGLLAAASFVRRPGAATITALLFLGIRWLMIWATPFATSVQSQVLELPFRSGAIFVSALGEAMPAFLFVAALIIDLALRVGEKMSIDRRLAIWVGAALGVTVNYLIDPRWIAISVSITRARGGSLENVSQLSAMYDPGFLPTLIAIPFIAALAGWLGWNSGVVLRHTDR